ncbi:FxsA family protein [Ornithinimicrobium pekingense]|uniref:FxsA family protein n=1 Tax=Ornithinimicrobium pekingense TaxID=384677 RepID=A0ABQ2FAX5_9MICO|nr:FxsA family protein [Ornithinimicrobium pekingense]GGK75786.1 hypothetical protein GCM10011509_25510 [Ornithinimicrobium pekingense]
MTAAPTSRRRPGILRWLLAALILLPLLEIVVLVAVGRSIGLLWTVGLLVAMALVGAWLARRETGRTVRALQRAVESGRMPADEVTDAILVMAGGFLLILPGFLSDVVGLLLVLPFTRPLARRLLQVLVAQQALRLGGTPGGPARSRRSEAPGRGQVIEGEVVAEEPAPGTAPGEGPSRLGP